MRAFAKIGFLVSLGYFFFWGCGNHQDKKLPIGNKLSGVKFLKKVEDTENLFFVVNTNNYKLYQSGSVQVRSRKELEKVETTVTVPSLATSITLFSAHGKKYLALSFEPDSSKVDPEFILLPYELNASKTKVTFSSALTYKLERSSSETFAENVIPKSVIPISASFKKTSKDERLVISCSGGELFVMDLAENDPSKWKAPVHVRSYGEYAKREALIVTKDDMVLLFPAYSEKSQKEQFSTGHDIKEEIGEEEATKKQAPKSKLQRENTLKEQTSPYQLVVYDLREDLVFKSYKNLFKRESAWLKIDLEGETSTTSEAYFRTNFGTAILSEKPGEDDVFYLSQRSSTPETEAKSYIHKVSIKNSLRTEWDKKTEVFDPLKDSHVVFDKKPAFQIVDEKSGGSSFSKDPRIYALYDFAIRDIKEVGSTSFIGISYNYKKKFYFLLSGSGNAVSRKYEKRSTKESYWTLAYWDDKKEYVTVVNAYKDEATLLLETL